MNSEALFQIRMKLHEANRRRKWFINAIQCKALYNEEMAGYRYSIYNLLIDWRNLAKQHQVKYY